MNNFVSRKEVLKKLEISKATFYNLVKIGKFEMIKIINKNKYNLKKFMLENKINEYYHNKENICYCRVSSSKQKKRFRKTNKLYEK